jgi:S1-C subfamily serine protease
MVTLANGDSMDVRLVGLAPEYDLAVLQLSRLPSGGVKKITVGTSKDLEVGQTVFAIGNPFGQQSTMTNGIISALHRQIQSPTNRPIDDAIQTNAALNPGNSGGPLLDKDGRLIGVNTAITSPSGGNVGIGYAIPVDTVNAVVTEMIRNGRAAQPYIGIGFVLPESTVRRLGYDKGVMVSSVKPGGPAAEAGLQRGDVIIKINGDEIGTIAALNRTMRKVKVGDKLKLTVLREDEQMEVQLKVEGI